LDGGIAVRSRRQSRAPVVSERDDFAVEDAADAYARELEHAPAASAAGGEPVLGGGEAAEVVHLTSYAQVPVLGIGLERASIGDGSRRDATSRDHSTSNAMQVAASREARRRLSD
jgi:hypothetical protein